MAIAFAPRDGEAAKISLARRPLRERIVEYAELLKEIATEVAPPDGKPRSRRI